MASDRPDARPIEAPLSGLERDLEREYLRSRGYDPDALQQLPEEVRDRLMKEASTYASAKLSEVESRAHFIHDIHEGTRND